MRTSAYRQRRSGAPVGLYIILAVAAVALGIYIFTRIGGTSATAQTAREASPATACGDLEKVITPAGMPGEMIDYKGFTVSFNPRTHVPNYVVWELLGSEAQGSEPRSNNFMADTGVKGSATPDDYKYTGYDRGHMAPAGDMKWDSNAMDESFYMTNMCPQAQELNRGAWKKLEEKCRAKAIADSAVIIVCGPIFDTKEPRARIGNTGVAVPDRFFKVILSPYTDPVQAIGFIMPNAQVPGGMQPSAVSVDQVEAVTGFDFFSALPDDIENRVEAECNFNRWSHTARRR